MIVAFPMNRTRLPTKGREAFSNKQGTSLGECSTCDSTYSGVTLRGLASLPRCSEHTKKTIYGQQRELPALPTHVKNSLGIGEPLVWQETKSVECFGALIEDLDIGAIFDCSPGSGALAEAAMQHGIHYAGVCANSHHMVWLQNALDRAALKQIMTQQMPLYDANLAAQIKENFMDVVTSLNMQGAEI